MSHLHRFDLEMCAYVVANVRLAFENRVVFKRVSQLPRDLRGFLIDDSAINSRYAPIERRFLLNWDEFDTLASAVRFLPLRAESCYWLAMDSFNATATLCTGEIRRCLAPAEAQRWAAASASFADELQSGRTLADGIIVVQEWTAMIRLLLEAMGYIQYLPRPQGSFPTPTTFADNNVLIRVETDDQIYVGIMRQAIDSHPKGKKAKADELLKHAAVQRKFGLKALRKLEKDGEYVGFARRKAARYQRSH